LLMMALIAVLLEQLVPKYNIIISCYFR